MRYGAPVPGAWLVKAAVLYEHNKPLVIESVDIEDPKEGEVQVRISATGICHSDLHNIKGHWQNALPAILGHEGAGIVEAVGSGVKQVKVGDRVIFSFRPNCGHCEHCVRGIPVLCNGHKAPRQLMHDGTARVRVRGQPLFVSSRLGTFAERVVCPEEQAVAIHHDIPPEVAALIGCSVTTGVCAVTNAAQVAPGESVAVIGCGGVGLNVIQGARLVGAGMVIAVDVLDGKLEYAQEFGATHKVNASRENAAARIRDLSGGGVDFAFEAIGLAATVEQALECIRPGGRAVVVGMAPVDHRASIDPYRLVREQKTLMGVGYGKARQRIDIPRMVDLYRSGKLDLDRLISHRYSLDEINEGVDKLDRGEAARGVVVF